MPAPRSIINLLLSPVITFVDMYCKASAVLLVLQVRGGRERI